MNEITYLIERARFTEKYKILSDDQSGYVAVRKSGILRGLLSIFSGLLVFLIGSAGSAMLSAAFPNFPAVLAIPFFALMALFLIFWFWPTRNINIYSLENLRRPLWILRQKNSHLPSVIGEFIVEDSGLPRYKIQNWSATGEGGYWNLNTPEGHPLIRVALTKESEAFRRALLLADWDWRLRDGLENFLDFEMIRSESNAVIADYKWKPSWKHKRLLKVYPTDIDIKLLISLAMVVEEGYS